jgi:hypothetical protein
MGQTPIAIGIYKQMILLFKKEPFAGLKMR